MSVSQSVAKIAQLGLRAFRHPPPFSVPLLSRPAAVMPEATACDRWISSAHKLDVATLWHQVAPMLLHVYYTLCLIMSQGRNPLVNDKKAEKWIEEANMLVVTLKCCSQLHSRVERSKKHSLSRQKNVSVTIRRVVQGGRGSKVTELRPQ